MRVKDVRVGSNHKQVCGSQKVKTNQVLSSHNHHHIGLTWESGKREKKCTKQLEREQIKNAHFWNAPPLAFIINFGLLVDFACPLALPLHFTFTCVMYLLTHYTLSLYCSVNVIAIAHWLWHLLLQLWLLMKFNSLPWFFFFHLYTYLWKIPCHLGFTFTLALPPRMGAFPPYFHQV